MQYSKKKNKNKLELTIVPHGNGLQPFWYSCIVKGFSFVFNNIDEFANFCNRYNDKLFLKLYILISCQLLISICFIFHILISK